MLLRREVSRITALVVAMFIAGCGGGGSADGGSAAESTLLLGSNTGQADPNAKPACRILAQCLDFSQAAVTNFKGGKKAAASYTFDDGYDTSFQIADLFEARGLRASFYIVASLVPDAEWASWKDLMARGHEVGNHTMTHTIDLGDPATTDAQLNTEIVEAKNLMTERLGEAPQVFAFPWHSSTPASRALALQNHFAIRTSTEDLPFNMAFFDQDHGTPEETMATVNQQLADTVAQGGWYVAAGHGIDGDGWSPVTHEFLNQHLDYASGFGSDLWTDTFLNVARYRICRKQASVQADISSSSQVKLKLNGSFAPACTEALTVKIPTRGSASINLVARDADGARLPVRKFAGGVAVDILPGQTVTLTAA